MIRKEIIQPINDLIKKQAEQFKDKIAYADENECISYNDLEIETRNLSKNTLNDLSLRRSYYGFLASHILDKQISIVDIPYNTTLNKLKKIKESFEIKRLYELYILGRKREARKELNFISKGIDDTTLNNMSVLFKSWGWNVGSILGYGKTKYCNIL